MAKKPSKKQYGGPRPNSGRPALKNPDTIHMRVEKEDKEAFIEAAKKSPQKTLTQWILAACREKLARK